MVEWQDNYRRRLYERLKSIMLGDNMSWFYTPNVTLITKKIKVICFMTHQFYEDYSHVHIF